MRLSRAEPLSAWPAYGLALLVTVLATALGFAMQGHVAEANIVMVYLLGVTFVASRCTPGAAGLASLLSVACFDFFFVHPKLTFAVADVQYLLTFGVMLAVSLLISTLTVRLRKQSTERQEAHLQAQVEKTRGDLLSAVSHDLRTPLAGIEGSASVLLEQPELGEESRQLAATIKDESIRMSHLIRNLLDMTRVQGAIDLDLDWYSLDELVANAILRTEDLFEHPVRLSVAQDAPLVKVDGVLIELVVVNLLENASRHAGRAARVEIAISAAGELACLTVTDNGPGIPAELMDRVFERFQGTKGKGAGLGLAICRTAVEAHGGAITANNGTGGGAVFTIKLPIAKEAPVG